MLKEVLEEDYYGVKRWLEYVSVPGEEKNIAGCKLTCIDQRGGEGLGSSYFVVFSVENKYEKKIYRCDGWYASYEGCEVEPGNSYEVEPQEKTVIEWVKK